jgi:hypothetical protein
MSAPGRRSSPSVNGAGLPAALNSPIQAITPATHCAFVAPAIISLASISLF